MNRSEHIKRILALQKERDAINEKIRDEAEAAFPAGSQVSFCKGRGCIEAEILWISRGFGSNEASFKIRSHTGKEYLVDLYDLIK